MALVIVRAVGSMYGQSAGSMPDVDFGGWDFASIGLGGSSAVLSAVSPAAPIQVMRTFTLTGSGLSITPDSGAGPDLSTRTATGIVESFSYTAGVDSHTANTYYDISGLGVSFQDVVDNSASILDFLLAGHDTIIGTSFFETMNGYGGDDVLQPGYANFYDPYGDVVNGGDGFDTVSYDGMSVAVKIDLTAGTAASLVDVLGERIRATLISIENASGGSGNDILIGTNSVNRLAGGNGDDVLMPGMTVMMSGFNDLVFGGLGSDTVSFAGRENGVHVDLANGIASNAVINADFIQVRAELVSIENAAGGNGNDRLEGDTQGNILSGNAGNDLLEGNDGADSLLGGDGDDTLDGGAGADWLDGGAGIDLADYGGSSIGVVVNLYNGTASDGDTLTGIENVTGSSHNDVLIGSNGANVLSGGLGDDQIFAMDGNDTLHGFDGNDVLDGSRGDDIVGGGAGNDGVFGGAGNDQLYGGGGNDYISGGGGNDVIWGEDGDDQVFAGDGDDFVVLGTGNDDFWLGAGDDRIRFDYGNGADTIRDFGNGHDVLDFTATDMTLAALQANTIETSAGVLMFLGSGTVLLEGLHLWQLEWDSDFAFA